MGGSSQDNTIRHAFYLEQSHKDFLARVSAEVVSLLDQSPYTDETVLTADNALCGGLSILNFPSLFDMFGKFMAGLDIEVLWTQIYNEMVDNPVINTAIDIRSTELDDELERNILPKFLTGARNVNAVMSSSFLAGKAILAINKEKDLNKFASELKLKAVDIAQNRWERHIDWNSKVIKQYADVLQLFLAAYNDLEAMKLDFAVKDKQWNLLMYEYWRTALGALNAGGTSSAINAGPSQAQKSVSGALGGAAMGTQIYPGYGTVIGAVVGLAASFF